MDRLDLHILILDALHHRGLRLCLSAFRTYPVDSLYVEANEPPLDLRWLKLTLQYIDKLKSNIVQPAYNCFFHPIYESLYEINQKVYKINRI